MSRKEALLVAVFGATAVLGYRHMTIDRMRHERDKLLWLEANQDHIHPPATAAERQALAMELHLHQEALKDWWPHRGAPVQWDNLPGDERFRGHWTRQKHRREDYF